MVCCPSYMKKGDIRKHSRIFSLVQKKYGKGEQETKEIANRRG